MNRHEQQPASKIDVRGIYSGSVVEEPEDLARAGVQVSFKAAAATWGEEKARKFIKPGTVGPMKKM